MPSRPHQKICIGLVGAGEIVRTRHLPALKKQADVEIVAVSNATYQSAERFCRENLPHATPMQDWAELLAVPELDVIWIGAPPYMHSAVTLSALEAGKHVFCQARMANDLAEAEEMLAMARRHPELVTMICPPPHGMRAEMLVQKTLAENYIGRPQQIRLRSLNGNFTDRDAPAHWRQRIEISGLNVLTLGIYVEVLQRWLGDITAVFARGKIFAPLRQGYEVIVPDVLNVLCTFANGAEGVLEFSGVSAFAGPDKLEIHGDAGTLSYNFETDVVQAGRVGDRALHTLDLPQEMENSWRVEDEFLAAVRSRGRLRPSPTFEDGVRYMRVVQAVADSRARGEWVTVKR